MFQNVYTSWWLFFYYFDTGIDLTINWQLILIYSNEALIKTRQR